MDKYTGLEVAVIGMACRLPGAANWRAYWANLVQERETIHHYSKEELYALGCPDEFVQNEQYVKAEGRLAGKEFFDAPFFSYTPHEVSFLNPVHRPFHECAWEAIEDAGINLSTVKGLVGVFGSATTSVAWQVNALLRNREKLVDDLTLSALSHRESLATLLSYKLDLQGTSQYIDTTCSSSLVAINAACKNLLLGDIGLALVGSVTIEQKERPGYLYDPYYILSADGHCRAFDAAGDGTVGSEGAAVVVLKRLTDAIRDKDPIYCVIKGSATNNDGKRKVGYAAPSVQGLVTCMEQALQFARVGPERISYVETHGTATPLGDLIEVSALQTAYAGGAAPRCGLGSVKTNIGHTWATSGLAGLIKVALSLKNQVLPASLHFTQLNPDIHLAASRFYVQTSTRPWERDGELPLCAALNAFGLGGTNAHVILEEYVATATDEPGDDARYKLLPLSAKTQTALVNYASRLHAFVMEEPALNLEQLAYTLQVGRMAFPLRKAFLFRDRAELLNQLDQLRHHAEPVEPVADPAVDYLTELCQLWMQGQPVDWAALYAGRNPSRISLPTYVFDQLRFPVAASFSSLWPAAGIVEAPTNGTGAAPPAVPGAAAAVVGDPLAGIEQAVAAIFCDFFGTAAIAHDEDFFELGGDSLRAVALSRVIAQQFGIPLAPAFLYDHPTIAELAVAIRALCANATTG